jgi:hypothetical protein
MTEQTDSLFTDLPATIDPNKDYLPELVGEDKKFKDIQALARSKVEADNFIESLKKQNQELTQELTSRLNMQDFLDQLKAQQQPGNPPAAPSPTPATTETTESTALRPEDIQAMLETTLTKREKERRTSENLGRVKAELQQKFGPSYAETVRRRAQELSVGEGFLNSLAAEAPAAFLSLIGEPQRQPSDPGTPPKSVFNTAGMPSGTQVRNYQFYSKLRRENPKMYFDPKTQMQMHKDASADPAGFYKT